MYIQICFIVIEVAQFHAVINLFLASSIFLKHVLHILHHTQL